MMSQTGQQIQSGNKIWVVNKTKCQKYFYSKVMPQMRQGNQYQTSFWFFKKAFFEASGHTLVLQ